MYGIRLVFRIELRIKTGPSNVVGYYGELFLSNIIISVQEMLRLLKHEHKKLTRNGKKTEQLCVRQSSSSNGGENELCSLQKIMEIQFTRWSTSILFGRAVLPGLKFSRMYIL